MMSFEVLQGGFAGDTGERTTIYSDGCFSVEQILPGRVQNIRSGRLDPDQVQRARAAIKDADFGSLPDTNRDPGRANPVTVSITYEGATKAVTLPPGTGMERIEALANGDPNTAAGRIARLLTQMNRLTR
jgi:hypothetical protein